MRTWVALLLVLSPDTLRTQAPASPVSVEFRIFAGTDEITAATRLRVMPTGTRDSLMTLGQAKRLVADIPPGIYDVQALRMRPEGIVAIKWAERLVVMHYPDEAGKHLEVVNFDGGYGALQLRVAQGSIAAHDIAVFAAGARTAPADPIAGDDYLLFILPAGRYDIRVRPAAGSEKEEDSRWLLDVEVPANRTRMKIIPGS